MSPQRLKISVFMPTYNRASFLPEALDCLLSQTRVPDEIIVVDDGSTDNTPEVLARYGPPVITIRQPNNRGIAAAHNTALAASHGDLIAILDSDDLLAPESIERRAAFLETHPDASVVYTGAYFTDGAGKIISRFRRPPLPRGNLFVNMICRPLFPVHAVMFRRSCIKTAKPFDETLMQAQDYDLWIRLAAEYEFEPINEPLAYYRIHGGNSVVLRPRSLLEHVIRIEQRVFDMPAFQQLSAFQQARIYCNYASRHFEYGDLATARVYYRMALRRSPLYPGTYLMLAFMLLGKNGFAISIDLKLKLIQLLKF